MNMTVKMIVAAALAAPLASYAGLGTDTSGNTLLATQAHSINFSIDQHKEPVVITDGAVDEAAAKTSVGAAVILASNFSTAGTNKYILSDIGAPAGLNVSLNTSNTDTTVSNTSYFGSDNDTVYINVVKANGTALTAGTYGVSYILSEYQS